MFADILIYVGCAAVSYLIMIVCTAFFTNKQLDDDDHAGIVVAMLFAWWVLVPALMMLSIGHALFNAARRLRR